MSVYTTCERCGVTVARARADRGGRYCNRCSQSSRIEPVVANRVASSPSVLSCRVLAVAAALRSGDPDAARDELRQLADEARLLSRMHPLFESTLERRQRIASEREPGGRIS